MGITVGKTRWIKWGLLGAAACLLAAAAVHTPVTIAPGPAPSPAPETPPGPLAGITVCVDPGHGGYDGGAYGASRTAEKELNLDVARQLADCLRAQGAQVILTREEDTALAEPGENRKRRDLQARVDAAAEADLFLSIHMNEYRSASSSGPQVFYRKGADQSRLLAGLMQERLNADLAPARPRQANTGEYYLLEHLDIPSVQVECGFLSNPEEEKRLLTPAYRRQVAEAICGGVEEFVRSEERN